MYKVGIVGYGHVGGIMKELFPDAVIYDEPKGIGTKDAINECDFAFVCVPTPKAEDGSCDTSIVERVVAWLDPKIAIILRSTVPVGFTDKWNDYRIAEASPIIFQPEYYGETKNHMFENPRNRGWITLGGDTTVAQRVAELYQTEFTSNLRIHFCSAKAAELAKYMENSFFSTKVIFCNQFYDLAEALGINYIEACEAWLMDPRIGDSHTQVYPYDRGYGGSCLPKDTSAIIYQGAKVGVDMKLLKAAEQVNEEYHKED